MPSLTIGGRELAVARPEDLDAQLVASTGCTAAEQAAILSRAAVPAAIARVLAPMLAEPIPIGELAALIAAGDIASIARATVDLLEEAAHG